jgi:hypothetical protein
LLNWWIRIDSSPDGWSIVYLGLNLAVIIVMSENILVTDSVIFDKDLEISFRTQQQCFRFFGSISVILFLCKYFYNLWRSSVKALHSLFYVIYNTSLKTKDFFRASLIESILWIQQRIIMLYFCKIIYLLKQ